LTVAHFLHASVDMPRIPLIRTAEHPYHVTARTNNKEAFPIPLVGCWKIFEKLLAEVSGEKNLVIHAFVLMPNHFHMLVSTPRKNLDEGLHYLMTKSSKRINFCAERINRLYGGRYRWCLVNSEEYYANALRYVFQNPLRSRLAIKVQEYPWSSLVQRSPWIRNCESHNGYIPESNAQRSLWLNKIYGDDSAEFIRKALRRQIYKHPRSKSSKRQIPNLIQPL